MPQSSGQSNVELKGFIMRKIILSCVLSIIVSFVFLLGVGKTTIDLKEELENNREYYGDVSLEQVAKVVYSNSVAVGKQSYEQWLIINGVESQIEEDRRQRADVKSQEQINQVQSVVFIFLIAWSIGLLPPLILRYAIMSRPIANWSAIGACVLFCAINIALFTAIGNQRVMQGDITLISFVSYWILLPDGSRNVYAISLTLITLLSYWILRRGTASKAIKVSAQKSESPASLMANTTDFPNPATADRHTAKGTPTSSPDRDANNASFAGKLEVLVDEEPIYATIAMELETGSTDKGLWTRLFAECSGDEQQIKILYIKQRAERLISAERIAAYNKASVKANPAYCTGCQKQEAYLDGQYKIFCPNCKKYVENI